MATHSTTLVWEIPLMEEPGRLQSMRSRSWTWLSSFTFTFHFHALEKEMATHSSVLAWRIPATGKPGGLLSLGSHRVKHDWSDSAAAAAVLHHIYVPLLVLPLLLFGSATLFILFTHLSIIFQILFPFRLLHSFEESSLCYTVGLCWLSTLNTAMCTCPSQTP